MILYLLFHTNRLCGHYPRVFNDSAFVEQRNSDSPASDFVILPQLFDNLYHPTERVAPSDLHEFKESQLHAGPLCPASHHSLDGENFV